MTVGEKRIIIPLLRRFIQLTADNRALNAILQEAQESGHRVVGWAQNLEDLRQTAEYRAVHAEFATLLGQIEQAVDEEEILELLRRIPPGPVN